MSKGSKRRPKFISNEKFDENWMKAVPKQTSLGIASRQKRPKFQGMLYDILAGAILAGLIFIAVYRWVP